MKFRDELATAARDSKRPLDPSLLDACDRHFALLLRWNRTHNLTRIVDPAEAARKHYLDCLVPLLDARERSGVSPAGFVDVGSGAGFPGLLACLAWPLSRATLVEPAQKRASFLVLAASAMGASATVASGAESVPRGLVLSRATFSPGKREELLLAAEDAVAVWGHAHDASTWKSEVATWGDWRVAEQPYEVAGLEPRSLLWAMRGEFHVKHARPIA